MREPDEKKVVMSDKGGSITLPTEAPLPLPMESQGPGSAPAIESVRGDAYADWFNFAPVGHFMLDARGAIQEVNLAGATLLGREREQLLRESFANFLTPEGRPRFAVVQAQLLEAGGRQSRELTLLHGGHGRRYVLIEAAAACRPPGEPRQLLVTVTDITERKLTEDALRFLAQTGVSSSAGGDFFRRLARYLAETLGMDYVCIDELEESQQTARTVAIFFDGKFDDNVTYTLRDTPCGAVAGKTICCFVEGVRQLFPKDAVLQEMLAESYVGTTLWSASGKPIGLIALISRRPLGNPRLASSLLQMVALRAAGELERWQAEKALSGSEAFSRSIIESSSDCIKLLDLQGRLRFMSKGGQRLLGIKDVKPYLGMLYRDFWADADKPKVEEAMSVALGGGTGSFSAMVPALDGLAKWWDVVVSPVRGHDGAVEKLLVVSRDVTAQHAAAEESAWLASFPRFSPIPVVEVETPSGRLRYLNPAAQKLLSGPAMGGFAHPWLAGLERAASEAGDARGQVSISREITYQGRVYRQEISRVPGGRFLRVYALEVTQLREAQGLLEQQRQNLSTLVAASQELLSATSVQGLLNVAAETARRLTGSGLALCGHIFVKGHFSLGVAVDPPGTHPGPPGGLFKIERGGVFEELLSGKDSIRYADFDLKSHPRWWGLPEGHAPLRGLLGARLVGSDGKACGVILASHKKQGDFTVQDEALLLQLAATTSLALRHIHTKEQAERRAEELSAVINAIADPVVLRDANEVVLFANSAAARLSGTPLIPGKSRFLARLIRDDGTELPPDQLPGRRALAGEQVRGERYRYVDASGRNFSLLVSASPLVVGGAIKGTVSTFHDVTERENLVRQLAQAQETLEERVKQRTADLQQAIHALEQENQHRAIAETALTESEQRYRTLVEAAPVGIAVSTFSGSVVAANRSLCRMLGLDPATARSHKVTEFYQSPSEPRRLRRQLRAGGTISGWETQMRRADGSCFDAVVHAAEIRIGPRSVLLTIAEDVSPRKSAERHVDGVRRLLELFVTTASRREYLRAVVRLLREWSGCGCVGIRTPDGQGQLPFVAQAGFGREFLEEERHLSVDNLDCPCVRALTHRTRPDDKLCLSRGNSFVSERLREDLTHLCGPLRDRSVLACEKAGYRSMAHAGIRYGGELIGTVHLADKRPGRIPEATVAFLESVAPLIGEALHRFQVEEALTESEERFRALFEKHDAVMLLVSPQTGVLVDVNPAACRFYSRAREQLVGSALEGLGISMAAASSALREAGGGKRPEPFEARVLVAPEDLRLLAVHSSAVSIRGKALLFLIVHDSTERRQMQKRLLEIGEEERQRVGQDLHDSLGGQLTGLALLGKALARRLQQANIAEAEIALEIVAGLNEAVGLTRAVAHGLCPVEQNELGLLTTLHEFAGQLRRRTGVECDLEVAGNLPQLDPMVGSHLFRIVQEAVANSLKHARPRHIRLSLSIAQTQLSLRVWNDGKSLPAQFDQSKGLGLRTMKYRADLIGAQFNIRPAAEGGTVVACTLPLTANNSKARNPSIHP